VTVKSPIARGEFKLNLRMLRGFVEVTIKLVAAARLNPRGLKREGVDEKVKKELFAFKLNWNDPLAEST